MIKSAEPIETLEELENLGSYFAQLYEALPKNLVFTIDFETTEEYHAFVDKVMNVPNKFGPKDAAFFKFNTRAGIRFIIRNKARK